MGMDIDPARGDKLAVGDDLTLAGTRLAADLGDPVAIDGDIAGVGTFARAVDDRAAPNDDIMHCVCPLNAAARQHRPWTGKFQPVPGVEQR